MSNETLNRNARRTRIGVVVSNKMEKTVVVACVENKRHPIYGKVYKQTTKFRYDFLQLVYCRDRHDSIAKPIRSSDNNAIPPVR